MPDGTPNDGFAGDVIEDIAKRVSPKAVFGDPIVYGDRAVIPVVTVSYGGGGGSGSGSSTEDVPEGAAPESGEGQGFGFGVSAKPVGTIEIGPDGVIYQPVVDYSQLAKTWSAISGIALLMLVARMLFARR